MFRVLAAAAVAALGGKFVLTPPRESCETACVCVFPVIFWRDGGEGRELNIKLRARESPGPGVKLFRELIVEFRIPSYARVCVEHKTDFRRLNLSKMHIIPNFSIFVMFVFEILRSVDRCIYHLKIHFTLSPRYPFVLLNHISTEFQHFLVLLALKIIRRSRWQALSRFNSRSAPFNPKARITTRAWSCLWKFALSSRGNHQKNKRARPSFEPRCVLNSVDVLRARWDVFIQVCSSRLNFLSGKLREKNFAPDGDV